MAGSPGVEFRLLGAVEAIRDGAPLALGGPRQRALLALLLVGGDRPVRADTLVEELWHGRPPDGAAATLKTYVSRLRTTLGANATIASRVSGYALEVPDEGVDVRRFERHIEEGQAALRRGAVERAAERFASALALWRGRPFGDVGDDGALRVETERLDELRLRAVEGRIEAQLELGGGPELVAELEAAVVEHPYRETLRRQLMLALYRAGRQKDALDAFGRARALLKAELGLEPGVELKRLQQEILRHEVAPPTPPSRRSSIPIPANTFFGRTAELAALGRLIAESRLVTLTGVGGVGKTRLAIEAARQAQQDYPEAIFVDLSSLPQQAGVAPRLATALDLREHSDGPIEQQIASRLGDDGLLLVLDNCEHLREACAGMLAELLPRCPALHVLATSREFLGCDGEVEYAVPPLDVTDAVDLFLARAQAVRPRLRDDDQSRASAAAICSDLDGLPLAIELAAARARALSVDEIADRLTDRFRFLVSWRRLTPARHRTLEQAMAWSYDLLSEQEQRVLAQLSVFAGGFTLTAVAAACLEGDEDAAHETLERLVAASLVALDETAEGMRYRLLETVRQYAAERLSADDPARRAATELALAEHFARVADDLRAADPVQREWRRIVERLNPEVDNLRVALAAAAGSGEAELLVRLAGGLWRYWATRGPLGEGLKWIERALAVDGPATAARACALQGGAGLAWRSGDNAQARDLAAAALPVAIESGSTWDERSAHIILGIVAKDEQDFPSARFHHERARDLAEQLGFEPVIETQNLGGVALEAHDYEEAAARFEEVIELARRNDNPWAMGLANLGVGIAQFEFEDNERSRHAFEEARSIFEQVGLPELLAHALQGIAVVDARESRFEEAARLLGQARRMLDEFGAPEDMFWSRLPETRARVRTALGNKSFEAAYAAGVDPDGRQSNG